MSRAELDSKLLFVSLNRLRASIETSRLLSRTAGIQVALGAVLRCLQAGDQVKRLCLFLFIHSLSIS